jgi:hypothetical protein
MPSTAACRRLRLKATGSLRMAVLRDLVFATFSDETFGDFLQT